MELPVAHGEGKFVLAEPEALAKLEAAGQVVLRYADAEGRPTADYPANPNGSGRRRRRPLRPDRPGLRPDAPPRAIRRPAPPPRWTRRGLEGEGDGLRIFRNAVRELAG